MRKIERQEKQKQIFKQYGEENQFIKLQEECGELISAISRHRIENSMSTGVKNSWIAEEIADVLNLIEQFKLMFPELDKQIDDFKKAKIDRQISRMEGKG